MNWLLLACLIDRVRWRPIDLVCMAENEEQDLARLPDPRLDRSAQRGPFRYMYPYYLVTRIGAGKNTTDVKNDLHVEQVHKVFSVG